MRLVLDFHPVFQRHADVRFSVRRWVYQCAENRGVKFGEQMVPLLNVIENMPS